MPPFPVSTTASLCHYEANDERSHTGFPAYDSGKTGITRNFIPVRKLLPLFGFLLLAPSLTWAAVTVDGHCADTVESFTDSASCTMVIAASAKPVFIYALGYGGGVFAVSSCTVGATSATNQTTITNGHQKEELWTVAAPPTGSQTITCSWGAGTTQRTNLLAVSFLGSDGTFGTPVTGSGTTSPASVTVSSATNNLVSDGVGQDLRTSNVTCAASTLTAGGSQTQQDSSCADGGMRQADSTQPGGASITMSWTLTGTGALNWEQIAADVHASGGAAACVNFIALMGVGCR
jgi:hypothetical protein